MNGRADKAPGHVPRQLGVGIQRNHETDIGELTCVACLHDEARIACSAQQPVQLAQFAALAFPPHPLPFRWIPQTSPMKKIEARAPVLPFVTIAGVESLNPSERRL